MLFMVLRYISANPCDNFCVELGQTFEEAKICARDHSCFRQLPEQQQERTCVRFQASVLGQFTGHQID